MIGKRSLVVIVLALQCAGLHAELLFRSVGEINGQQRWSPIKKYVNPQDVAYERAAAPADEVRVILSGEVTGADLASAKVMAGLLRSGRQKLAGNTIWLSSNGGDIDAAMDLGRLFRKMGVYTVVARNDQCLSACVFAFMGGERRMVAGRLGIHRPFFPYTGDVYERPSRFRYLQKVLRDYVEELDFPASLYEAVMLVPPETMHFLSPADLKRFYLEGISPLSEDLADAASARRLNLSMHAYLQLKAKTPACGPLVAGHGRCEGRVQEAASSGGAVDDPGSMPRGEGALASRRSP